MKKVPFILLAAIGFMVSCNNKNSTETGTSGSADSLDHTVTDDRNNRNTTVYDSTGIRSGNRDTASYEAMPNKISDSTPK